MQKFYESERPDDDPMKRRHMWGTPKRTVVIVNDTGKDADVYVYPPNSGWKVKSVMVRLTCGLFPASGRVEFHAKMRKYRNEECCYIQIPSGKCGPVKVAKQEVLWSVVQDNDLKIHRQALSTRKIGRVVLNY